MAACKCVFNVTLRYGRTALFRAVARNVNVRGISRCSLLTKLSCENPIPVQLPLRWYSTSNASVKAGSPKLQGLADEILKKQISESSSKEAGSNEGESEEERKKREASWKAIKYTFLVFGVSFGAIGIYMLVEWGAPRKDENGEIVRDEFSDMPLVQQYFLRMLQEINYYKKMIRDPSRDKLLPDPLEEPYYQPPYTLVLEMTGLLVHPDWTYQTGWRFKKRPAVDFFLSQVAPPLFEVVVYTAELGFTAFPILDALDPNGCIAYRLVRDATRYVDGHHIKDLDCLNRDLKKVIVVDCNPNSVKLHSRNAIVLPKWQGNDDDRMLVDLAFFLKTIATEEVADVREVLDFYHKFDNPLEAFKENQRKLQEQQEEMQKMQKKQQESRSSLTGSWTPNFLRKT
ncbi:mitochondrial import inner membrane translocase subunit TIM50-C-like [Ischnura elegans]|uniref:mitochondrial import inner membrane translocase subunit TIM50-C-like n=1 Tax=Ischnura elegans TaxID=197161 RepID=UPI001ED8AD83|nr:mitochondrial import inner membrane translocase subunit TIM50-C-like [Ischnura elegans]